MAITEKRFFYRDSLAAAWMSKHFRMRFKHVAGGNHSYLSLANDILSLAERRRVVAMYEIHRDSVDLLQPQPGDRISFPNGIMLFSGLENDRRILAVDEHCWQIVQRAGKPFHTPESEAV